MKTLSLDDWVVRTAIFLLAITSIIQALGNIAASRRIHELEIAIEEIRTELPKALPPK